MVAIQKRDDEQIQIDTREFRGKTYVDIRVWYLPRGSDEYAPTRKGLSFALELLPEFQKVIAEFETVPA